MLQSVTLTIQLLLILLLGCTNQPSNDQHKKETSTYVSHRVDPKTATLKMVWQDETGLPLKTFKKVKELANKQDQKLLFAMNGGMFTKEYAPQGLYIENSTQLTPLVEDTSGYGNFYMQPNGVFYLTDSKTAHVVTTKNFLADSSISYATQSGPMLVHDGILNSHFGINSTSLHYRNGVGILPDGEVLFVISTVPVNFHSFASYFKSRGCKNALYLDGYVSRIYLPEKGIQQMDGKFGVMITEVASQ